MEIDLVEVKRGRETDRDPNQLEGVLHTNFVHSHQFVIERPDKCRYTSGTLTSIHIDQGLVSCKRILNAIAFWSRAYF